MLFTVANVQLLETAAQLDGCPRDKQYCRSDFISPITATTKMHSYSKQGSVAFMLILLEAYVIRVLLSDTQLSACINQAAASVEDVSLTTARASGR